MNTIHELLANQPIVFIKQIKEWAEVFINIETRNKYELQDRTGMVLANIKEVGSGFGNFIQRMVLRSHRPLNIELRNLQSQMLLSMTRPFFFFFSTLTITDDQQRVLGSVHRKWGIIKKKYILMDAQNRVHYKISSPIWRLWTFKIYDLQDQEVAMISKKWGGILKEVFTDADRFGIDFNKTRPEHHPLLLAAAISIDFDFFEENQRR